VRALGILEPAYGKNHVGVALTRAALGTVLRDLGQHKAAKEKFEQALEILESAYGKDHVTVASTLTNLGNVLVDLGQHEAAKEKFERALVIDERAYGKDHVKTAIPLTNLGNVLADLGQYEAAKEKCERALVIDERAYGKDHVAVASTLTNLGNVLRNLGQYEAAKEQYVRALGILEPAYGKNHVTVAIILTNLGANEYDLDNLKQAFTQQTKALRIFETHQHPSAAYARKQLEKLQPFIQLVETEQVGDCESQYWLGVCFEFGFAVTQNLKQAKQWYEKAAHQGHGDALLRLGLLYASAKDDHGNITQAAHWEDRTSKSSDSSEQLQAEAQNPSRLFSCNVSKVNSDYTANEAVEVNEEEYENLKNSGEKAALQGCYKA